MDEEKEIELPVKKPRIEEVEKIDNSRYMNDGSHSEFSTARFVEVFRNEERKQRKAMLFRTRFKNFDMCSLTSGLTLEDAEWTHISGEFVQRRQITGKSYPPDQHNFNPFNAEIFLGLTSELISASGGGHLPPKDVTEFVFKRTMKTVMNYCNWMYRLAKFKNKRFITAYEVEKLLVQDKFRFYQYFRHFYPKVLPNIVATDPSTSDNSSKHKSKSVDEDEKMEVDGDEKYSERPVFHNQFSTLLHHHYHITPGGQTEWHSVYWEQEERRRFEQIRLNVNSYRHLISENVENKSFVAPYGTLSPFFAHRFYELLAMPPLDTEIITVLAWLARRVITESVYAAVTWCTFNNTNQYPTLRDYQNALKDVDDVLLHVPMNNLGIPRPSTPPAKTPSENSDRPNVNPYYRQRKAAGEKRLVHRQSLLEYYHEIYSRHFPKVVRVLSLSSYVRERAR